MHSGDGLGPSPISSFHRSSDTKILTGYRSGSNGGSYGGGGGGYGGGYGGGGGDRMSALGSGLQKQTWGT